MAVSAIARTMISAPDVVLSRPVAVIGHNEVQFPVIVVLKPGCASTPFSLIAHSCPRSHIGERSIAVVAVKNATVVAQHVEIRESIIIIVSDGHTHTK